MTSCSKCGMPQLVSTVSPERETDIGRSRADLAGKAQEPNEIKALVLDIWYGARERQDFGITQGVDKLRALVSAREQRVREALWVTHVSNPAGLYGDDGEMQCGGGPECGRPCDFKRAPIAQIVEHIKGRPQPSLSPEIEERIEQMAVRAASGDWWQSKVADTTRAIVRDAVAAKDTKISEQAARIAELDGALLVSRRRNEAREQRIIQLAAAVEASRDVRLERDKLKAANVALGHEKELALAEAYRENERLRAEHDELKAELAEAIAVRDQKWAEAKSAKDARSVAENDLRTARQDARDFARAIDLALDQMSNGDFVTRLVIASEILAAVDTSNYVDGGE